MQNSTKDDQEYCKNLIRMGGDERLLQLHFLPPGLQQQAMAYYALEAELRHVHDHVSEEMIGHIRYAWWREAMDRLGAADQQHPVLRMLKDSNIDTALLIALIDSYREAYPELPANPPQLAIDDARYRKAGETIAGHKGARWRLLVKLLFV